MKNVVFALFTVLTLACGTSSHPPTADGAAGTESCGGYGPNDACMNEENFAACQAREAECPGQVLVLESCPLQFRCP